MQDPQKYFLETRGIKSTGYKGQIKLSTRFNPTPYTVVSKDGNSLIVQSQEGAQYSCNTAHVKKLLQHDETPSMQEGTVYETSQTEVEPIQQQSVPQEPNVAKTKVPA